MARHGRTAGRTAKIWESRLRRYAFPQIGKRRVDKIDTRDVMAVLLPIWNVKRQTARRIRQYIGAVMKWSVAEGHRQDNPAGDAIGAALPKSSGPAKHYRTIPHSEVRDAIARVRDSGAGTTTKLAIEFLILTAARSGEVRFAEWSEIDLDAATWTVPAERMKTKRAHRVPLSARALAIPTEADDLADASGLIFPSPRGKPLSDATLSKLIRELGIKSVPHGFRSSFRDWVSESTNAPREVAEAALAHVVWSQVEAAYARSDLFDKRRKLMDQWATYLNADAMGQVVPMVRRG